MIHVDDFPLDCLRVCCGFYDRDIGCCLCPPLEKDYACPLSDAEELKACFGEGGDADGNLYYIRIASGQEEGGSDA